MFYTFVTKFLNVLELVVDWWCYITVVYIANVAEKI